MQVNWPDGHLDLNQIPAPWRLVHLGCNSFGEWSCELTYQAPHLEGWLCACVHRQPSSLAALQSALAVVENQTAELRKFELGVYHLNVGAQAAPAPVPMSLEDL